VPFFAPDFAMAHLAWYQLALIALIFAWSGFVRSGLGFGGAVLSLPFLLLIDNEPLVFLPLIAAHLLFFSSAIWIQNVLKQRRANKADLCDVNKTDKNDSVDWAYLKKALSILIVPKLIGVFGLLTLPQALMSKIIFCIVGAYAISYIVNRPFRTDNRAVDIGLLALGGYISGTSLIGAPLIMIVFAKNVEKHQLRDTLFALWFILVCIKMAAFIVAGVDLQLIHHLWLLPCAAVGHFIGLRFHRYIINADQRIFFRVLGSVLLAISAIGLWQG
jgi:uncharacterized membrane protein YfcA